MLYKLLRMVGSKTKRRVNN